MENLRGKLAKMGKKIYLAVIHRKGNFGAGKFCLSKRCVGTTVSIEVAGEIADGPADESIGKSLG